MQDRKKDKKEEISLEDLIEKERAALATVKFTKITLESFLEWKKRKIREKQESAKKEEEKKRRDYKAGMSSGVSHPIAHMASWFKKLNCIFFSGNYQNNSYAGV